MLRITLSAVTALFALSVIPDPAQAQLRVFVAAQGSDSNNCSFATPCRTLQHAHDVVTASGEIDVLDPAGYGSLTINKSISIQGHGWASLSAQANGIAIIINAGTGDAVNLRGVIIEGFGVGNIGILFNSGGSLLVEHSVVRNFATNGIDFFPSAASSLVVSQTTVSNNGSNGILVRPQSSVPNSDGINAMFSHVELHNNFRSGITLDASFANFTNATAVDCVVSNVGLGLQDKSTGFLATTANFNILNFIISRSTASGNHVGVTSDGVNAAVFLAQSTFFNNNFDGNIQNGGQMLSYGDNYFFNTPAGLIVTSKN